MTTILTSQHLRHHDERTQLCDASDFRHTLSDVITSASPGSALLTPPRASLEPAFGASMQLSGISTDQEKQAVDDETVEHAHHL